MLALPSRDYYLKASSEGDLKAYHRYMTQTAVLLGANAENAFKELDHVVKFEMKLANVSKIRFRPEGMSDGILRLDCIMWL